MKRFLIGLAAASIVLTAPLAASAHEREGHGYRGYSDQRERFEPRYRSDYRWHGHRGWHHYRPHHWRHRHWH